MPLKSGFLASMGLGPGGDDMERKRCLAEWSAIARTGLRKIKKKYNKLLAARCGTADSVTGIDAFAFLRSRERTEIEALAPGEMRTHGLDCPVCLETLVNPVAPPCGHAVCSTCFDELT